MDRTERGTLGLVVVYTVTLLCVTVLDEPILWLAWAAATVIVTGVALIVYNR